VSLTETGAIMGTPHYMAPEQAWRQTGEVGPSADIYSLGAIMYKMLTGRPPFTGERYQVITNARTRPPVRPCQRRDSLEPALDAICMKCLEKSADRRYPSMGSLAEDLQRFLSGSEVDALRESSEISQIAGEVSDSEVGALATSIVSVGTTEPGPSTTKSWWQFWR
jgi:eukaryotic-like serine/threonine-protein kinase